MTRQYESEVPVRVQLVMDGSPTVRLGGFGARLLDQMTYVAASIAHATVSVGDSIGSYFVDGNRIERIESGAGQRAFYRQLQALAKFSVNPLPPSSKFNQALLDIAYAVCNERNPELLDPQVNPSSYASWRPTLQRPQKHRVQMAGAVAELYSLAPLTCVQMIFDDDLMTTYLQKFLSESGMPWMGPVVTDFSMDMRSMLVQQATMANALSKAITHAKDNEVFVLLVDLLCNPSPIHDLINAVRIARSKHHRVAIVCPSPTFVRPGIQSGILNARTANEMRFEAEQVKLKELATHLKRLFAKFSVPLSISGESNAIQIVMSEIALARNGRSAMQGASR